jgi:hypothetical protein
MEQSSSLGKAKALNKASDEGSALRAAFGKLIKRVINEELQADDLETFLNARA